MTSTEKQAGHTGNAARRLRGLAGSSNPKVSDYAGSKLHANFIGGEMARTGVTKGGLRVARQEKKDAFKALGKQAMDQELAHAVVARYQSGLPVDEAVFFKAAQAIGADPHDALLEARFATMLSHDLPKMASGERLSDHALTIYSAAAGEDPRALVKTASKYRLDPQELVLTKLAEQEWIPNLELLKLALMAEAGGAGAEQMQAPMQDPAAGGMGGQPNAAMPPMDPAGPMPGAAVQAPRYKPSPMAPMQTPPSSEGNLQELVDAARHPDAAADAQAAAQNPGGTMAPDGAPDSMGPDAGPGTGQEAPPPVPPEQKIQQVDPSVDPETMARWAPKLQEIEQQTGIQMNDPQQVQKFVAEMQKADAATLDTAIKEMNTPQPFNKPTNPNSPNAQTSAESQQGGTTDEGAQKVAGLRRRAYLP